MITINSRTITAELAWLKGVIEMRLEQLLAAEEGTEEGIIPELDEDPSPYAQLVREQGLTSNDRLVLILTLAPHVQPALLDYFFLRCESTQRGYTEFGGIQGKNHGGFLPTGETALFLIAGNDLEHRIEMQTYL